MIFVRRFSITIGCQLFDFASVMIGHDLLCVCPHLSRDLRDTIHTAGCQMDEQR